MKSPFKMKPGRGNMPKTGKDIPLSMKSPMYMMDGPGDKEKKKAKVGEIPDQDEIKERFKGKYTVTPKKGKTNEYTLMDKSGHSVSYKAGAKVEDKSKNIVDILNTPTKKNK